MKELKVDAIKNGTVIDHIKAGKGLEVARILKFDGSDILLIASNLSSKKIGKKDIIKIENKELTPKEVNSIALVSENATLIIIENFKIISKSKIELPQSVDNLIKCPNPKCISNVENINSKFYIKKGKETVVRCHYCEKKYPVDEVSITL